MKKQVVGVSAALLLGAVGTAIADEHKQSICHNGSTYNAETMEYDPISFEITIAGKQHAKAVDKHVANHGDLELYTVAEDPGIACELNEESVVVCDVVTLCGPVPEPI